MSVSVEWSTFKSFVTDRSLSIQYIQTTDFYYLVASDQYFSLSSSLDRNASDQTDIVDFETNYKSNGNKSLVDTANVQSIAPFGTKTINVSGVTKKLYARNTGMKFTVNNGSNTLSYTMTYPWAKLLGAEIVGCDKLDTTDFKVYDTAAGTYSGVANAMLNQFGFTVNLNQDFYQRISPYDADVYVGMVLKLTYVSVAVLPKTIGVNLILNEVKA